MTSESKYEVSELLRLIIELVMFAGAIAAAIPGWSQLIM